MLLLAEKTNAIVVKGVVNISASDEQHSIYGIDGARGGTGSLPPLLENNKLLFISFKILEGTPLEEAIGFLGGVIENMPIQHKLELLDNVIK